MKYISHVGWYIQNLHIGPKEANIGTVQKPTMVDQSTQSMGWPSLAHYVRPLGQENGPTRPDWPSSSPLQFEEIKR